LFPNWIRTPPLTPSCDGFKVRPFAPGEFDIAIAQWQAEIEVSALRRIIDGRIVGGFPRHPKSGCAPACQDWVRTSPYPPVRRRNRPAGVHDSSTERNGEKCCGWTHRRFHFHPPNENAIPQYDGTETWRVRTSTLRTDATSDKEIGFVCRIFLLAHRVGIVPPDQVGGFQRHWLPLVALHLAKKNGPVYEVHRAT
jgi:hypothetical protein